MVDTQVPTIFLSLHPLGWAVSLLSLCQLHDLGHFFHNLVIVLRTVWHKTRRAVLDAALRVSIAAAAISTQSIQRAIAEQAAELLRVCALVAGKILALPILHIFIMLHKLPSKKIYVILRKTGPGFLLRRL